MYPCGTTPSTETARTDRAFGEVYGENGTSPWGAISTRDASQRSMQKRPSTGAIPSGQGAGAGFAPTVPRGAQADKTPRAKRPGRRPVWLTGGG